jgi:ABC-2 type transport system ATP-binding protein
MTARQLLRYFANLRGLGESGLGFGWELAERLDANLDTPMRRLSRGNKQKIGIIQAMFHQPDLIMLDEPTSGLDPLVQETFLSILREAREKGQTIFFSSHILSDVEQLADRVGIARQTVNALEAGRYAPSLPLAFKIAKVFDKAVEEVFDPTDVEE